MRHRRGGFFRPGRPLSLCRGVDDPPRPGPGRGRGLHTLASLAAAAHPRKPGDEGDGRDCEARHGGGRAAAGRRCRGEVPLPARDLTPSGGEEARRGTRPDDGPGVREGASRRLTDVAGAFRTGCRLGGVACLEQGQKRTRRGGEAIRGEARRPLRSKPLGRWRGVGPPPGRTSSLAGRAEAGEAARWSVRFP